MIIRIPIRIHLLKYLRGKVGAEQVKIQHYSQLSLFEADSPVAQLQADLSKTIYPFLNTNYAWEDIQVKNKLNKYGLISLELKDYLVSTKKIFLSFKGVVALNDLIDAMMVEELSDLIDSTIANHKRQDIAILEFMNKYSIDEDDIRFDSLKKRIYRERLKQTAKIFISKNLAASSGVLSLSFGERLVGK